MSNRCLRQGFLAVISIIGLLIGYGVLRYPLIVREAGLSSILAPVFMLLIYGGIAIWATHQPGQASSHALRFGTRLGLVLGMTFAVMISVENFGNMSGRANAVSTLGFMLFIFLIFAYAGWRGTNNSKQILLGIFTSVWTAMVGVLIALVFGFMVNFLFTQRLEENLRASAEYLRSGSNDLETFTFWNTLDSAFSHLLEAPILAAIFGTLGSLIHSGFDKLRKDFAVRQR